jgi:hypothetical protein
MFIWGGTKWFRCGNIHFKGHWKGWALKIDTFWDLNWQRAQGVPFGPKKVEFTLQQRADIMNMAMCVDRDEVNSRDKVNLLYPGPPSPHQAFVQHKLEINSDMKSA